MNEKQLATSNEKPTTIKGWISSEEFKKQVALALPKYVTPERFVRVILTAIMRNPKLAECTQHSVLKCCMDLAAMGLEPNGREAHLIPFENRKNNTTECTLIADYKGLVKMVRNSGEVDDINAQVVFEKDEFECSFGTGGKLFHRPYLKGDRGEAYCVYCFVKLKDGAESYDVMTMEAVDKVRDGSQGYMAAVRYGKEADSPWTKSYDEMARKTIFRRHSKWLPLSSELKDLIDKDNEPLTEEERFENAKPVKEAKRPMFKHDKAAPAPEASDDIPMDSKPQEGAPIVVEEAAAPAPEKKPAKAKTAYDQVFDLIESRGESKLNVEKEARAAGIFGVSVTLEGMSEREAAKLLEYLKQGDK